MVETQVTTMVIKVDLGCEKCHKKIKRVLCAIPQIQNQAYDKKENKVTITVVGCCPEKIKKKIYCKGGEAVKCIEIIKPPPKEEKPTQPQTKPKPPPKDEKLTQPKPPPQTQTQPKPPPQTPSKPHNECPTPRRTCCAECYRGISGGPCYHDFCIPTRPCYVPPKDDEPTQPPSKPHNECPTPRRTYCAECYNGISGGPCYQASGRPTRTCDVPCGRPTRPCDVPCGRPVCDIWAVGGCSCRSRGFYVCRCEYVYEDYPPACKMM